MAITATGQLAGSVSGGCVEGAVAQAAAEVLSKRIPKLLHFGVADETAWEIGLACGGEIDVFVEPLDLDKFHFLQSASNPSEPVFEGFVVAGPQAMLGQSIFFAQSSAKPTFSQFDPKLEIELFPHLKQHASIQNTSLFQLELAQYHPSSLSIFVHPILPPPSLIIIGGVHIAIALTKFAQTLNFHTTIIDPRRAFGNRSRFPDVDQLVQAWPQEAFQQIIITPSTALASLTHDPKLDDPAIVTALNSPAFYIGALGSKNTHAKRLTRLAKLGITKDQLDKIKGPIGLRIGAKSPEEIALSIMAEIVATQHMSMIKE